MMTAKVKRLILHITIVIYNHHQHYYAYYILAIFIITVYVYLTEQVDVHEKHEKLQK